MNNDRTSGVSRRDFATKDEMLEFLGLPNFKDPNSNGYESYIQFETTPEQDKAIYEAAMRSGERYQNYNVLNNNCGQWARDVLSAGGVQFYENTFMKITGNSFVRGMLYNSAPNFIGTILLLSNPSARERLIKP